MDGGGSEEEAKRIKEMKVKEVTTLMESALQNLIQVSNEKREEQKNQQQTVTTEKGSNEQQDGNFLQRPTIDVAGQRTSLPDIPLTPRERDILQSKSNSYNLVRGSHSIESILCDNNTSSLMSSSSSTSPPPKPPLPNRLTDPPPLPPKKRNLQQQSSYPILDSQANNQQEMNILASEERSSWRSKSPEDNSSLLSASAGSLDSSTLNQSRDEDLFELEQQLNTGSGKFKLGLVKQERRTKTKWVLSLYLFVRSTLVLEIFIEFSIPK